MKVSASKLFLAPTKLSFGQGKEDAILGLGSRLLDKARKAGLKTRAKGPLGWAKSKGLGSHPLLFVLVLVQTIFFFGLISDSDKGRFQGVRRPGGSGKGQRAREDAP